MISLHDLTLQIPFITNNSILDVGKVSQSGSALYILQIKKQNNFQKARTELLI